MCRCKARNSDTFLVCLPLSLLRVHKADPQTENDMRKAAILTALLLAPQLTLGQERDPYAASTKQRLIEHAYERKQLLRKTHIGSAKPPHFRSSIPALPPQRYKPTLSTL